MSHLLISDPRADLKIYPKSIRNYDGYKSVVVARGDTHGNVMNIVYTLIAEGICQITETAYTRLAHLIINRMLRLLKLLKK